MASKEYGVKGKDGKYKDAQLHENVLDKSDEDFIRAVNNYYAKKKLTKEK